MSNASGNDPQDHSNHSLLETLFGRSKPVIAMMHLLHCQVGRSLIIKEAWQL